MEVTDAIDREAEVCRGPLTQARDSRFTPIGRFLSLSRLDELPQVWNVIRGDMRIVGPRPDTPELVAAFAERYGEITTARPGITGLTQLRYAGESHLLEGVEDTPRVYREQIL